MSHSINIADRNMHIESIVRSNLITFGLSSAEIDAITHNISLDIIDALEGYALAARETLSGEEE